MPDGFPIYDGKLTLYPPGLYDGKTGWSISVNQVWLPGIFASEEAARYAVGVEDKTIDELQQRVNATNDDPDKRLITLGMLREATNDV